MSYEITHEDEIYAASAFLRAEGITDAEQYLKENGYTEEQLYDARSGLGYEIHAKKLYLDKVSRAAELRSLIKSASEYTKKNAEWIIPLWIPKGVITIVYGDGGSGKSYFTLDLISKLSKGEQTMLDREKCSTRKPMTILYCNHEDNTEVVTLDRLEKAGADMNRVYIPDLDGDTENKLHGLKLKSEALRNAVESLRPDVVIMDPLQSFIDESTQMAQRNQMRACFAPLELMGHTWGTTFIVICHSNKKGDALGRSRISDSSDIWDIARAVMTVGETKDKGIRYTSLEKSSYAARPDSVLFSVSNDGLHFEGLSANHEREFRQEMPSAAGRPPERRESCEDAILDILTEAEGHTVQAKYLADYVESCGYSQSTIDRAKTSLYKKGLAKSERRTFGGEYFITLIDDTIVD